MYHPISPLGNPLHNPSCGTSKQQNSKPSKTSEAIQVEYELILSLYPNHMCCSPDGSKIPDRAAGKYLIDTTISTFGQSTMLSINSIGLTVIYHCLFNLPNTSSKIQ